MDVVRTFKKEEIKDAKAVVEVVCLAPVLEKDIFRDLLKSFYDGIDHSGLLDIHQVQGLAQLIQGADTGYLDADDLVKILGLLKFALPSLASPSLLDRVQNKPDVEGTLRQLKKQRLKERGNAVYIQPQAKAGLQASDDQRFPLMGRVQEFLDSNQKVFLLLGDSGAGKSTFNQHLEYELWQDYKKTTGGIPLFINLPATNQNRIWSPNSYASVSSQNRNFEN